MKIYTILISLLISFNSFSQDFIKEISLPESYTISDYGFTYNGNFYLTTNKKMLSSKLKDEVFTIYDKNSIEKINTYKLETNNSVLRGVSPNANTIIFDYPKLLGSKSKFFRILNSDGDTKTISDENIEGDLYNDPKTGIMDFTTNSFYYAIARKEKNSNENFLLKRSLSTASVEYTKVEISPIKTDKDFLRWRINKISDNNFILLAKDFINETSDRYHIAFFDETAQLIKKVTLQITLPDNFLCYSNNGAGTWELLIVSSKNFNYPAFIPTDETAGNVCVDNKNKVFYTYGLYSSKKKFSSGIYTNGFYVYKFDWEGKLLWKKMQNFDIKSAIKNKHDAYKTVVNFYNISDFNIGLCIKPSNDENIQLFNINANSGEIIEAKNMRYKISNFGNLPNFNNMNKNDKSQFTYILKDDYSKKLVLNLDAIAGAFFNRKFNDYLLSKKDNKNNLNFISTINDSGILVFQSDNKDHQFQLIKFDW